MKCTDTDELDKLRSLARVIADLSYKLRVARKPLHQHFVSPQTERAICATSHALASFVISYTRDVRPGSVIYLCLLNSDPVEQLFFRIKYYCNGQLTIKKAIDGIAQLSAKIFAKIRAMVDNDFVIPDKGPVDFTDNKDIKVDVRRGNTVGDEQHQYCTVRIKGKSDAKQIAVTVAQHLQRIQIQNLFA